MENQFILPPLPDFFIGKELTADRIANYAQKHRVLTQSLGRDDTRSVWYSKEHVSQLLDEINFYRGDGLRIFFGAYEANHPCAGQTCLLMVATRPKELSNGATCHENIIVEDDENFGIRQAIPRDYIEDPDGEGRPKGYDHGSPCPPFCDFSEGFEYP